MQTSAKSIFQFFARLHFLTQIFCTFLQSLRSEQGMNLLCSLVMLIVISIAFLRTVFDDKVSLSEDKRFSLGYGYLIWV